MEYMGVVMILIVSIVIPWVVQLVKTKAVVGKAALVLAVALSVLGAVATALAAGMPIDPASWSAFIVLVVISVQGFYGLFKSAGVTSKWLDALLEVQIGKEVDNGR